jgi:glycosyltransferase involved in cell wall biosynthesis
MQPLVTVIIPNYNHAQYLEQRILSILNQTYNNWELFLLDDNSTDNSLEILQKFQNHPKVKYSLFNQINTGNTFKQWETGIKLAKGEYIWIAESDDFCSEFFLEQMIPLIHYDSEIGLVYCQSNRVDENNKITGNWITHTEKINPTAFNSNFIMDGNLFIEEFLIYKNVIPNASAVLFRNERIKIISLNNHPNFKSCGDWLFYFEILLNNKIAFNNNSLNNFRYHKTSVISQALIDIDLINIHKIEIQLRRLMNSKLSKGIRNYIKIKNNNYKEIQKINFKIALLLLAKKEFARSLIRVVFTFNWLYYKKYLKKIF